MLVDIIESDIVCYVIIFKELPFSVHKAKLTLVYSLLTTDPRITVRKCNRLLAFRHAIVNLSQLPS